MMPWHASFPLLGEARARWTGGRRKPEIAERWEGNIANASPAADSLPALLAYEAELILVFGARVSGRIDYLEFHTGYKDHPNSRPMS